MRSAVKSYVKERDAREKRRAGRDVRSDAGTKLWRYVLGQEKRGNQEAAPLASVHLHALKEDDLITWREGLPENLNVTTKQRFVNDLKAALNAAWPRLSADRKKLNPTFLAIVKAGFNAQNPFGGLVIDVVGNGDWRLPVVAAFVVITPTDKPNAAPFSFAIAQMRFRIEATPMHAKLKPGARFSRRDLST